MIDLQDKSHCPTLEEIAQFVRNPIFMKFCLEIKDLYKCSETIEFSRCSWQMGWNIKFKKAGKTLCTIYPKEFYFTVMVVVGKKEKTFVEAILPQFTIELQEIYHHTQEGNGQRWLMIDLENQDDLYRDLFQLIQIRRNGCLS